MDAEGPLTVKIEILANPFSGAQNGPTRAGDVAGHLARRGHQCKVVVATSREAATEWASQVGDVDRIAVVGGDGSLAPVVEGLTTPCPPLALCPLGTGNMLGKELKIPTRAAALADMIENGRVQEMDTGILSSNHGKARRRSCILWGFGLDAELMKRMEEKRQGPLHKAQYLPLLGNILKKWKPVPQRVVADGEDLGEFDFGFVSGTHTYATPLLKLAPCAYDDGFWELYLIPKFTLASGTLAALGAASGKIDHIHGLVRRKVKKVQVIGRHPAPVQTDGDYIGCTPVEFELDGARLPLLVPNP